MASFLKFCQDEIFVDAEEDVNNEEFDRKPAAVVKPKKIEVKPKKLTKEEKKLKLIWGVPATLKYERQIFVTNICLHMGVPATESK